jgi:3'(2'),5'-bisphosphate nucleotidase
VLEELDVARDLARRAGEEILRVRAAGFEVVEKSGDEGPVTIADHRADHIIRTGLGARFPNDSLLTEETPDDLARLGRRRVWIVDPLDGTRQFVQRGTEFAVMIGLAIDGRAVLGVVHLPCEDLTYVAAEGQGAREIDGVGKSRLLRLDPLPEDPAKIVVAVSRSHCNSRTRAVVEALGAVAVPSGSVGRKAALVASGQADLYINMGGRSRHWDACASDALVRAAGGAFLDAAGRPILYNTEQTRNRSGLLACRSGLVDRVVAESRRVRGGHEPETST